jgi:hypothetical protein
MNTGQLACAINSDTLLRKSVSGVFSSDNLPNYRATFIANTDPSTRPGAHWIACFVDERGRGEYFDTYGRKPSRPFASWLNKYTNGYICNTKILQSDTSAVCGFYCLFYLLLRCRGITLENVVKRFTRNKHSNDLYVYAAITEYFCYLKTRNSGQGCHSLCRQ